MKTLRYTHPASNKYNPKKIYILDDLLKDMDIKKIKVFFTPVDFKWEDLDKPKLKKKDVKIKEDIVEENNIEAVFDIDRVD